MLKVSIMTTGGKRSLYFITLASLFGWWRFIVVGYAALGVGLRSLKAPFFLVLFHVSYQISMPVEVFVLVFIVNTLICYNDGSFPPSLKLKEDSLSRRPVF